MKIQKCNSCKTKFHDKPWMNECPVCRSKNINHNEDGSLFKWQNYGDINFLEYGGCLVRETDREDCFNVIWLATEIADYKKRYNYPMMVAKCYVDLSSWLDNETLHAINTFTGNPSDFIPKTLEEKMWYAVDLIGYYGIAEFEPDFPIETNCSCYGFTWDRIIVGKTIAQRFLKENGVPYKWRK